MKSVCTSKKFDELRIMVKKDKAIGLDQLPPTSSVIRGHIQRAYFDIRNDITLLEDPPQLDPLDFGWKDVDGVLLPEKNLKPIPDTLRKLCGCAGKCDKQLYFQKLKSILCNLLPQKILCQ